MALYIGLDCGWERVRYEVQDGQGRRKETGSRELHPEALKQLLGELLAKYGRKGKVTVAFEAGTNLYWVDDVVRGFGVKSHPFHAGAYKMIVESKKKTDKIDARKIAEGARKGILPRVVVVPRGQARKLRRLVSERETWHKELVRWASRLRAHAVSYGVVLQVPSLAKSEAHWEWAIEQLSGEAEERAKRMYRSVLPLFQNLEEVDEQIRELMEEKVFSEASQRLQTYPGVGPVTAAAILAWTGVEASRFAGSREAASYFGLVGSTYQSGKLERGGHITKQGPPIARRLLIQAGWAYVSSARGRESAWGRWFCRIAKKRGKKIAIVGLARKLLTAAVASLQTGKDWDPTIPVKRRLAAASS
jgi:transposase